MTLRSFYKDSLSRALTAHPLKRFTSQKTLPPKTPIFIIGMMARTGTNFLNQLLYHHPHCIASSIYEPFLLRHIELLKQYTEETQQTWGEIMPKELLPESSAAFRACIGRALVSYLEQLTPNYNRPETKNQRLIIKTPDVVNIDDFFEFFPNYPLLILVRDGRAVVESHARSFGVDRERAMYDWANAAEQIIQFVQSRQSPQEQYLIIKYETLHSQTEQEVSRIFDFLNVDKSQYRFKEALNLPVIGSSTFGRTEGAPISWEKSVPKTAAFDPLSRARDWTVADNKRFEQIAGESMKYFGYSFEES